MRIEFTPDPDDSEIEAVLAPLTEQAEAARPGGNYRPFGFLLKDEASGAVTGGLTGYVLYDWMFVQFLSVPAQFRGQGYGRKLMVAAETWARDEGLVGMWLDTFEFQARGFYEKLGFGVFGTIEDHPLGSRRYFLSKRLAPASRWEQFPAEEAPE